MRAAPWSGSNARPSIKADAQLVASLTLLIASGKSREHRARAPWICHAEILNAESIASALILAFGLLV
ncbi:hypothetical protein [Piscinibacter gummiphilus]|uniref:hypothetical protein n=1 Tax=Piscinibacter gummiphilus TaxID=946333 RepID=UPI001475EC4D|nr:hypothetical protein [Piscinibacter gummiphilus]